MRRLGGRGAARDSAALRKGREEADEGDAGVGPIIGRREWEARTRGGAAIEAGEPGAHLGHTLRERQGKVVKAGRHVARVGAALVGDHRADLLATELAKDVGIRSPEEGGGAETADRPEA